MRREERTGLLRIVVLGGGAAFTELHLPALQALGWTSRLVVVEPSARARARLKARDGSLVCVERGYAEFFDDLAEPEEFDAALVALPNSLHAEAVEAALLAGLHVLCEKPLALEARSCERLGQLADDLGRILSVGMVRRFLPSVGALREALRAGFIGPLENVHIECGEPYDWPSDSGSFFAPENGGVLADVGVHYLDLIAELCGACEPIAYTDDWRGGVEANAKLELVSSCGVRIKLALSRTRKLRNTAIFQGERGILVLAHDAHDHCLWRSDDGRLIGKLSAGITSSRDGDGTVREAFIAQWLAFAEAIRGGAAPSVSGRQAAETMRIVEWAYGERKRKRAAFTGAGSETANALARRAWGEGNGGGAPATLRSARVVITGATGFIGGHLVARLSGQTREIIAPVRNYATCVRIARFPVELPRVDLLDLKQVTELMRGARIVFHLAYGSDERGGARLTIEGTRNVVEAAIACGVECVVVMSTVSVFGRPEADAFVDETWPYGERLDEYSASKAEMERWCLQRAASGSGATRIVVLNPSCVYGPEGKLYTQLPIQQARKGKFCWVEEGRGAANYTYVDNLIDAMMLATERAAEAHGQRFIINDGCCSWREFLTPLLGEYALALPSLSAHEILAHRETTQRASLKAIVAHMARDQKLAEMIGTLPVIGRSLRFLFNASPIMRARLAKMRTSNVARANGALSSLPPEWLVDLFGPATARFSSGRAARVLGWRPHVTLAEGQRITAAWLREVGLL